MIRINSIDIIVPLYNEAECISMFHDKLHEIIKQLDVSTRIIYIDDGSKDDTVNIVKALMLEDSSIELLRFPRNFGHQSAITAGIDFSNADCVIMMDGDGQHPPELIPEMIQLYKFGYDIVATKRIDSDGQSKSIKGITSRLFYKIINYLSDIHVETGTADFRLISKEVAEKLKSFTEIHRFYRGLIPWLGFKTAILPYNPPERMAGSTKYTLKKMVELASTGIFSFSLVPLRLAIGIGLFFLLLAFVEVIYLLSFWLRGNSTELVPGWSSTIFLILISGCFNMFVLSIMGIYIGMIFQEIKKRPIYVKYNNINREINEKK